MAWNADSTTVGPVDERYFTLQSHGREVPGIYWSPTGQAADKVVLLGHGGSANKKVDYIELIAHGLCGLGIAAFAIDGPGHGDRPGAERFAAGVVDFKERWESDGGTGGIVADWRTALDFVEQEHGQRPTGYLGLSMGTMMGLPVCVADDRISVAVLGLMGTWGPNRADLARLAPELSIPVRFLVQWDDEVVPREQCLELFDALGTAKKSLHAHPGAHSAVPTFAVQDAVGFLAGRLG